METQVSVPTLLVPPLDLTQDHILAAEKMYLEGIPTQIIAQMLQIHKHTIYQYLKKRSIKLS
ncbi:MAG: helix-turn-helix domain-containing protein [Saprospiraceae bacterium]